MNQEYYCPVCRGQLKIGQKLVFAAKSPKNKKGLLFLSPELGNYTYEHHPSFEIIENENYIFYCPICHAQLNDAKHPDLIRVLMDDEHGERFEVYFSSIASVKSTYKLKDKQLEAMGPEKEKFEKYFDLPDEYKKYL